MGCACAEQLQAVLPLPLPVLFVALLLDVLPAGYGTDDDR
jgi:hypothetical protein